jgi:hypothetical protein
MLLLVPKIRKSYKGGIMAKLESDVQGKMMRTVRKYGGYVYKNAQSMYTEKGRPDLTACIPVSLKRLEELFGEDAKIGVFVGIEVKRNKKVYDSSDAQIIVGKQIQKASGLWFSIDDPDIVEALMLKFTSNGGN